MEYIKVVLNGSEEKNVSVLINGEKNGWVGDTIIIEEGYVEISAKVPGAIPVEVEVKDTIPIEPMEIIVNIE